MATPDPVEVAPAWAELAATGYQWLFEIHDGGIHVAFGTSAPAATVRGHLVNSGDVVTPPTGEKIYARSLGPTALVTVSQGNAA